MIPSHYAEHASRDKITVDKITVDKITVDNMRDNDIIFQMILNLYGGHASK